MNTGEFSVYQFFEDDTSECVRRGVDAEEAVNAAHHYCNSVGARLGFTKRVIITDAGDFTNFEWRNGEGVVYPPAHIKQEKPETLAGVPASFSFNLAKPLKGFRIMATHLTIWQAFAVPVCLALAAGGCITLGVILGELARLYIRGAYHRALRRYESAQADLRAAWSAD